MISNLPNPAVTARKYRSFALLAAAIVSKPVSRKGSTVSDAIDALVISDRRVRRSTG